MVIGDLFSVVSSWLLFFYCSTSHAMYKVEVGGGRCEVGGWKGEVGGEKLERDVRSGK